MSVYCLAFVISRRSAQNTELSLTYENASASIPRFGPRGGLTNCRYSITRPFVHKLTEGIERVFLVELSRADQISSSDWCELIRDALYTDYYNWSL